MLTLALFLSANGVLQLDYVQELLANFPDARVEAPLYTELLTRGSISPASQTRFDWRTLGLPNRRNQVNNGGSAYDGTTTAIVVDDATLFPVNHLVLCEATREVIYVTARNTGTNTLTVVRGIGSANGGVAAAAGSVADDAWLTVIGPAAGEGTQAMAFRQASLGTDWNQVQNFKETVRLTGEMLGSQAIHTQPREYERLQKFQISLRSIERAFMFGARATPATANSETARTSHGLFNAIVTNRVTGIGAITRANVDNVYAASAFAIGSMRKTAICGPTAFAALQTIYRGTEHRMPSERLGGSMVTRILTAFGELDLQLSRALVGGLAGAAVIVDTDEDVRIRTLGRPAQGTAPATDGRLQLVENTGAPDLDGVQDEWRANLGLQWGNEARHALWLGITGTA